MHPRGIAQGSASLEIPEPIPVKEGVVDEHIPAVPVGTPTPAAPTPTAPAAKIETQIYAGIPPQTHIDPRVKERRVNSPVRWSPYVCGIVIRHIPYFRVCRLDGDRRLPTLVLSRDGLLRRRTERPFGLGFGPHALHRLHHVRLLGEKSVTKLRGPVHILSQVDEHIGKSHQPLYAGIPLLLFRLVHEFRGFPVCMVP